MNDAPDNRLETPDHKYIRKNGPSLINICDVEVSICAWFLMQCLLSFR